MAEFCANQLQWAEMGHHLHATKHTVSRPLKDEPWCAILAAYSLLISLSTLVEQQRRPCVHIEVEDFWVDLYDVQYSAVSLDSLVIINRGKTEVWNGRLDWKEFKQRIWTSCRSEGSVCICLGRSLLRLFQYWDAVERYSVCETSHLSSGCSNSWQFVLDVFESVVLLYFSFLSAWPSKIYWGQSWENSVSNEFDLHTWYWLQTLCCCLTECWGPQTFWP